jgi:DNA transposition AAA+ family ATPase
LKKLDLIQVAIESHLKNTNDSQNTLANKIGGVSPATLSQIRQGKFAQLSDRMVARLASYFGITGGEDVAEWQTFETRNYQIIHSACQDAKENCRMLAIAGYTGAGKTTALKAIARTQPNVYYVLCNAVMSRKEFIRAVTQAMGIEPEGSISANLDAITGRMLGTEKPLLVLDDAGKLSDANLRLIQIIYDATEFSAGIVLAGTEYLKTNIDKNAAKDKAGFRELRRRISYWQPLKRPSTEIVKQIAKAYAIDDTNAVSYLAKVAPDYGTLRNLITNALKMSQKLSVAIDRQMLADLNVGDAKFLVV